MYKDTDPVPFAAIIDVALACGDKEERAIAAQGLSDPRYAASKPGYVAPPSLPTCADCGATLEDARVVALWSVDGRVTRCPDCHSSYADRNREDVRR